MVPLSNNLVPRDASACLIITHNDNYILQLRDNSTDIFFPNRLGLFGGAIEVSETPLQAVVREVHEELSTFFPAERYKSCGQINLICDGLELTRYFFILRVSPLERKSFVLTEGQRLEELSGEQLLKRRLTPYDEYFLYMQIKKFV